MNGSGLAKRAAFGKFTIVAFSYKNTVERNLVVLIKIGPPLTTTFCCHYYSCNAFKTNLASSPSFPFSWTEKNELGHPRPARRSVRQPKHLTKHRQSCGILSVHFLSALCARIRNVYIEAMYEIQTFSRTANGAQFRKRIMCSRCMVPLWIMSKHGDDFGVRRSRSHSKPAEPAAFEDSVTVYVNKVFAHAHPVSLVQLRQLLRATRIGTRREVLLKRFPGDIARTGNA